MKKIWRFARDMFSGSGNKTLKELESRMAMAAENEEFEKAALSVTT